jgi:FHA domain
MIDDDAKKQAEDQNLPSVHRARNRTVVLTPDITGHVRAKLASDGIEGDDGSGFIRPRKLNQPQLPEDISANLDKSMQNEVLTNINPNVESLINKNSFEDISHDLNSSEGESKHTTPHFNNDGDASFHTNGYRNPLNQLNTFKTGSRPFEHPDSKNLMSPSNLPTVDEKGGGKVFSYVANQAHSPNNSFTQISRLNNQQQLTSDSSYLVGFMVSYDKISTGEAFELREGRNIVSKDIPSSGGKVIILDDPDVSSMHAILKVDEDGSVVVLDQLSESGTFLIKRDGSELKLEGDRANLEHGDILKFGSRTFKICLIKV